MHFCMWLSYNILYKISTVKQMNSWFDFKLFFITISSSKLCLFVYYHLPHILLHRSNQVIRSLPLYLFPDISLTTMDSITALYLFFEFKDNLLLFWDVPLWKLSFLAALNFFVSFLMFRIYLLPRVLGFIILV